MNQKPASLDAEQNKGIPTYLRYVSLFLGLIGLLAAFIWLFVLWGLPVEAPAGAFSGWSARWLTIKTYPIQTICAYSLLFASYLLAAIGLGNKR